MAGRCPARPGTHCSEEASCRPGGTSRWKERALAKRWSSAARSWWYLSSRDKSRARNHNKNENSDMLDAFLITFFWLQKVSHVGRPKGSGGQTAPLDPTLSPRRQLERKSHKVGKHLAHLSRSPKDQSATPKRTTSIATSSPGLRGPQVSNLTTGLSGLGSRRYSIAALV